MIRSIIDAFQQPTSACRGSTFWSWNGDLQPAELRRQIRIFQQMGMGGFFMHSRGGLATPYLTESWFTCIDACIDEAEKQGMLAWLYDEDRWPSGFAGGLITRDQRFRMRELRMCVAAEPSELLWGTDLVAAFIATVEGPVAEGVERISPGSRPRALAAGESLLLFKRYVLEDNLWYNGAAYLDTMNPEAVAEFIRVTHKPYRQRYGSDFGQTVPGIFSDEPHYGHKCRTVSGELGSSWTDRLPELFQQRYGYDLLDHLPELFLDVRGLPLSQARYHYHDCTTHLFVDAYMRQVGTWCKNAGLAFIGHVLEEDNLSCQTNRAGSCMRSYEHMQIPGMDILTEDRRIFHTAKQVSSAARQFGRLWRVTETYGLTGWGFSFEGHKALCDWQAALGINMRCHHLSWYTMEGSGKRDYPASISFQSPWWRQFAKVEDYFARIHAAMTRGTEIRDVLMIHPVESMWTRVRRGWLEDPQVAADDVAFQRVTDVLLGANIDFDYGDEEILSRHGAVLGAGTGVRLRVAQAEYRGVVVPAMRTMRASTLALLTAFQSAGGQVVFLDGVADHIDALPSQAVRAFAAGCPNTTLAGVAAIVAPWGRRVSITVPGGAEVEPALHLLREDAEAFYLFIANTGMNYVSEPVSIWGPRPIDGRDLAFANVEIRLLERTAAHPVELDPDTGEAFAATAVCTDGRWVVQTALPRLGTRLFVFPKVVGDVGLKPRRQLAVVSTQRLGGTWTFALSEPNAVVLDVCRWRIGDGAWHTDYVLKADSEIRRFLNISTREVADVQPWMLISSPVGPSSPIEVEFRFQVKELPRADLQLALEQPSLYAIEVNGNGISTEAECGWWVDPSTRLLPVSAGFLKLGENTIRLRCTYDRRVGLEAIHLLGWFGAMITDRQAVLTALPEHLELGDWCSQGLTFFSGNVAYRRTVTPCFAAHERVVLQVPDFAGVAVHVLVDGVEAGVIAWDPRELDLTAHLVSNQPALVTIEVLGSRRNSHGPFHSRPQEIDWTDSEHFRQYAVPDYRLKPYGLMAAPCLTVLG